MKNFTLLTVFIFLNSSYENIKKRKRKKHETKYNEKLAEYHQIQHKIKAKTDLIRDNKENESEFCKVAAQTQK